ncbi:MAG: HAMP domain-containing protein [Firmicutes bacterium]|nr:HAMP domain-containing protein [Bacillota bacterium]
MSKKLSIAQRLYGVLILLSVCIGVLGVVSWMMRDEVVRINDQAKAALSRVNMLNRLEVAHVDWALMLSQSLNLQQPFQGELDHTRCALGSWYHEYIESDDFQALPTELQGAYLALDRPHANLHRSAQVISNLLVSQNYSPATWGQAIKIYEETTLVDLQAVRAELNNIMGILEQVASDLELEADQTVLQTRVVSTLVIAVSLIIAFFLGGFTVRSICRSLKRTVTLVQELAKGGGDLTQRLPVTTNDEMGKLAQGMNDFIAKIHEMMSRIAHAAVQTASSSAEVAATIEETSSSVASVAATSNEFASSIQSLNENSQDIAEMAKTTSDRADEGSAQINQALTVMQDISNEVTQLSAEIEELNQQSDEIRSIVEMITAIADQTNLLALNAAIEAARAGEHGRGFSVVSEEVRTLAEQSANAASDIADLIGRMQRAVQETVTKSERSSVKVSEGIATVSKSGQMFQEVREVVNRLTDAIMRVASATHQISAGAQEIAAGSEEQSASLQEVAASMDNIALIASQLQELVNYFKI